MTMWEGVEYWSSDDIRPWGSPVYVQLFARTGKFALTSFEVKLVEDRNVCRWTSAACAGDLDDCTGPDGTDIDYEGSVWTRLIANEGPNALQ